MADATAIELPSASPAAPPRSKRRQKNPVPSKGFILLGDGSAVASARMITVLAALLAMLGLVMIVSTSTGPETPAAEPYKYFKRQLYALAGCVALAVFFSRLDYRTLAKKCYWGLAVLWVLLIAVLFMPKQLGAHRWLPMPGLGQLQPSEFAKVGVIVWASAFAQNRGEALRRFWGGFVPGMIILGVTCGLVVVEPDNGTAMFLAVLGGTVLLVNGMRLSHMLPFVAVGLPAAVICMSNLHSYVEDRLRSFQGSFEDKIGQVKQALIAIGSGGLFGVGIGSGRAQLGHVSKIYNDFVLAAVGQQLGFVGTATVAAAFVLIFLHGLRLAARARDQLGFSLAFGASFMIVLQAAVNIAVATDTVPPKGINLPFVSYGGSSLLCLGVCLGILNSVARVANGTAATVKASPSEAPAPAVAATDPSPASPPRRVAQREKQLELTLEEVA